MFAAFIHGFILALGLILPLGAQNVFVFNQGASQPELKRTLPVVLTASISDTLLILLAVLGVSVLVFTVPVLKTAIFAVGIVFLLYMGWSIWKSDPANMNKQQAAMPIKKQVLFALSVSLLNPHAILDTIGVIGTSSLSYHGAEKAMFTAACIITSWLWFLGLAITGKAVGSLDHEGRLLRWVNKCSAMMIWGVTVYLVVQLIQAL